MIPDYISVGLDRFYSVISLSATKTDPLGATEVVEEKRTLLCQLLSCTL